MDNCRYYHNEYSLYKGLYVFSTDHKCYREEPFGSCKGEDATLVPNLVLLGQFSDEESSFPHICANIFAFQSLIEEKACIGMYYKYKESTLWSWLILVLPKFDEARRIMTFYAAFLHDEAAILEAASLSKLNMVSITLQDYEYWNENAPTCFSFEKQVGIKIVD